MTEDDPTVDEIVAAWQRDLRTLWRKRGEDVEAMRAKCEAIARDYAEDGDVAALDIANAIAALAAEPAGGEAPPPPAQGEEETVFSVSQVEQLRERLSEFGSNGLDASTCLGLVETIAALRQRADEATRAENEACAIRLDAEAKRHEDAYDKMDPDSEESVMHLCAATDFRSIAAAIRARLSAIAPQEKGAYTEWEAEG